MNALILGLDDYSNLLASANTIEHLPGGVTVRMDHPVLGKLTAFQSNSQFAIMPGAEVTYGLSEQESSACLALLDEEGMRTE